MQPRIASAQAESHDECSALVLQERQDDRWLITIVLGQTCYHRHSDDDWSVQFIHKDNPPFFQKKKLKATFDSNALSMESELRDEYLKLIDAGRIEIQVTSRVPIEATKYNRPKTFPYQDGYYPAGKWGNLKIIPSIARLDVSYWGYDVLVNERLNSEIKKIWGSIVEDNDHMDLDHLYGHLISGNDAFITSDKRMYKELSLRLWMELRMLVLHPREFLEFLKAGFG